MADEGRTVLVATVGTGRVRTDIAEAIAFSARRNGAGAVVLLSSPLSAGETSPEVRQRLEGIEVREWSCPEGLEDDVQGLLLAWEGQWDGLLAGWQPARVVVDFTSGTKPMSAAAFALAIWRRADAVSYVIGPRDVTGRATASTDVKSFPPSLVVARQELALAAEHFNAGSYAAARDLAGDCARDLQAAGRASGGVVEGLGGMSQGLRDVAAAYEAWDRFDWKAACVHFRKANRSWDGWTWADPPGGLAANYQLVRKVEQDRKRSAYTTEMLADLLGNVDRCFQRSDWDDAVARLYRACEMLAQKALADRGLDTANIDPAKLPEPLQDEYRRRKDALPKRTRKDGTAAEARLKLGLEEAYELLAAMGDQVGKAFQDRYGPKRDGPLGGLLSARNQSLLAHGITPISEDRAKALREEVVALARLACGASLDQHLADAQPVRVAVL